MSRQEDMHSISLSQSHHLGKSLRWRIRCSSMDAVDTHCNCCGMLSIWNPSSLDRTNSYYPPNSLSHTVCSDLMTSLLRIGNIGLKIKSIASNQLRSSCKIQSQGYWVRRMMDIYCTDLHGSPHTLDNWNRMSRNLPCSFLDNFQSHSQANTSHWWAMAYSRWLHNCRMCSQWWSKWHSLGHIYCTCLLLLCILLGTLCSTARPKAGCITSMKYRSLNIILLLPSRLYQAHRSTHNCFAHYLCCTFQLVYLINCRRLGKIGKHSL